MQSGGFFDTEDEVLGIRLKRIEDIPHPSANAVAILVLLKLAFLTGNEECRREAERSPALFAGSARTMGVHAGTYFCALDAYERAFTLTIEALPGSMLARQARFAAGSTFSSIAYGPDHGRVIACRNGVCSEPVSDPSRIASLFNNPS